MPNAAEWELKTQRKNTASLLTLFHMEPSPIGLHLVPYLLENFGWPHQKAGTKYPDAEKSFRQTLRYRQATNRGFYIDIENAIKRVSIKFKFSLIKEEHAEWSKTIQHSLQDAYTPYWGFNDLFHKAGTKLKNCFYVTADVKKENGKVYIYYYDIKLLSNFIIDNFLQEIRNRNILIDFDARSGHNHGTKFRIVQNAIPNLYADVQNI